ncbi:MAG: VOC family protein [Anaerolineae bacterium]|nr:VOC family protein [Anaerolineae bacterium]
MQVTTTTTIHPDTRLGHVHYTVANLDRQIAFYRDILGFKVHWREGQSAGLGAGGDDLLRLTQMVGARMVRGTTGLYHTAFLIPTRWDLAHLLRQIIQAQPPIDGFSNHGTHLAIYLPDAEGNGIELAWDFPKAVWPQSFGDMIKRREFDLHDLLAELNKDTRRWDGLNPNTQIGHVHLHVADIEAGNTFYHDVLGFEYPYKQLPPPQYARQMRFFSAGDYHHHIGTNIWQGENAPRPPADATGLRYFTVVSPTSDEYNRLIGQLEAKNITIQDTLDGKQIQDPSGNGILLSYPTQIA